MVSIQIILFGDMILFSIFLFLQKYELYLYHWDNLLLYPISFMICFIRNATYLLIVWKKTGLLWNECLYSAYDPNVYDFTFLLLKCRSCKGEKEDSLCLKSPVGRIVWQKKHSHHSAIEFESLNSFNDKNLFFFN